MDQMNLGYSTKNIPIPGKMEYLQKLIDSAEKFIKSLRWRTHFFLNPSKDNKKEKNTFGFRSTKTPPKIPELKTFEDKFLDLVQNVQFNDNSNDFQKKLNQDRKEISKNERLLVAADKTTNFYKVKREDYNKLLDNNITKTYKKAPDTLEKCILEKDKAIADNLDISDRIDSTAKNQCFITIKDHKPNFRNNTKCRLINPTKSEIGKISKQIL